MRNNWDVETGFMDAPTFERILAGLSEMPSPPTVMFSGIGEPLSHGRIAKMIAAVKALGCRTEMITNGTLLTEKRSRELIAAGLDVLWVSIDGARPESYADVRLGAELPRVLENLKRFRRLRRPSHRPVPEIGIAFVAMKRNIGDLPELLELGKRPGRHALPRQQPAAPHGADERRGALRRRADAPSPTPPLPGCGDSSCPRWTWTT
jgi:MoaA/NifB/PqqE/SkfB family radical SAM enzyme